MQYIRFGKTDLRVSELCLGTMVLGETGPRGADKATSLKIIDKFIEEGGNFIDTADVYSKGVSETIVGEAIKENREELIIATKCRFPMGDSPNMRGVSRKYIFHAIKESLKRLDTEYIDLLYLHGTRPEMSFDETLRALDDLVSKGKIHYIGVSNFRAWEVMKALAISARKDYVRFEAAQYQYSLVERNIEHEFIGLFQSENIGLVPWGPLGGGFLSGKYKSGDKPEKGRLAVMPDDTEEAWHRRSVERNWKILDIIEGIKEKTGKSFPQIALNWLAHQPTVTSLIIGVRTLEQLEDNLGAIGWKIDPSDLKDLNDVSKPIEEYPYRFIRNYCLDV